jgi:ribose/xylose/arabinose/galactoside ABC-type transport system permease subunit
VAVAERKVDRLQGVVGRRLTLRAIAEQWSLLIAFAAAFIFFSIARPQTFLTWANAKAILDDASPLSVLAAGVTVVLVMGEFDLSIGAVVGLASAGAVSVMAFHGWPTPAAVTIALLAGAAAGLANGIGVTVMRIPSFIATLAMGSIAGGIELAITQTSIFQGLHTSYLNIALTRIAGFPLRPIIAAGVTLVFLVILRTTVFGRNAHAVGDNPAAARLAGLPIQRIKISGFVLTGATAGIAAVLITSSAGSYYPNLGTGLLLPAYAAAFLGLSLGGGLRFNVLGSYLGVLLLGMVTTGLTMMNQPSWVAALVQGLVLVAAVAGIAMRRGAQLGR